MIPSLHLSKGTLLSSFSQSFCDYEAKICDGQNCGQFEMALKGVVVSVTGNFDRDKISSAIRKAGGRVDALVHKNVHFVVSDEGAIEQNTQRIRKAMKFGIPIVSERLIIESLKAGKLVEHSPFLLRLSNADTIETREQSHVNKGTDLHEL